MGINFIKDAADILAPQRCMFCFGKTPFLVCSKCVPVPVFMQNSCRCEGCFSVMPLYSEEILCEHCEESPLLFEQMAYLWDYDEKAELIISDAKYVPSPALCEFIGQGLGGLIMHKWPTEEWDVIVPVPPAKEHLIYRGFSHTGVIAKTVSNITCIDISYRALKHEGYSARQVGLTPTERIKNVAKSFTAYKKHVANKRVLLVDDVITTGATATAATKALLKAGAISVTLLAAARSKKWNKSRDLISTFNNESSAELN